MDSLRRFCCHRIWFVKMYRKCFLVICIALFIFNEMMMTKWKFNKCITQYFDIFLLFLTFWCSIQFGEKRQIQLLLNFWVILSHLSPHSLSQLSLSRGCETCGDKTVPLTMTSSVSSMTVTCGWGDISFSSCLSTFEIWFKVVVVEYCHHHGLLLFPSPRRFSCTFMRVWMYSRGRRSLSLPHPTCDPYIGRPPTILFVGHGMHVPPEKVHTSLLSRTRYRMEFLF